MRSVSISFAIALAGLAACSKPAATPAAGPVKITQFYAAPPNPPPGQQSLVCYGTENATSVKLDPPDHEVWPSPSRCFAVVPKGTITYTLTALRDVERVSQSVTVGVGEAPPEILAVNVDAREVPRGTVMHVCYKAKNAASVTITPGRYIQHESDRGCVQLAMEQTTLFKVRALDARGEIADGEDVEVKVTP